MRSLFTVTIVVCLLTASALAEIPEVRPAASAPCFPGAYYRKAASSFDHWTGIEAVVKLPQPDYDMSRTRANGRPLDNASVYIGGRAGEQEIDCGVNWEVIREPNGSVSTMGKAFRPFVRNEEWHSGTAKPEFYYYPGDVIRMRLDNTADGKLLMRVDLLARAGDAGSKLGPVDNTDQTTHIVATESPAANGPGKWPTSPVDAISSYTATFDAREFRLDGIKQFKRVNGMDQSGNEGKPVQPTESRIIDATWQQVWLLRGTERVPMTPERFTDMRCPDPSHIKVEPFGATGETVTLIGNPEAE